MDEQMIEEMAKDMLEYGMEKYPTCESVFTEIKLREQFYHVFLTYAEHLIKKDYRKIPEGAVVLTREEYQTLKLLAQDKCHYDCPLIDYPDFESERMVRETTLEETAEKFAERLKADVSEDNELHEALNACLKRDYFEYIDKRCKEFIGEMK